MAPADAPAAFVREWTDKFSNFPPSRIGTMEALQAGDVVVCS